MDHLERIAEEFSRQAQSFERWAEKADDAASFRAALGAAGQGRLLDIACGPGVITAALAGSAAAVTGLDTTDAMLERARARCARAALSNVELKRGDAENLPFADASFDGVVTRAAVHHFADPQRAFNQMFRVLRGGGRAVVLDVVSSEDAGERALHNAIEELRDPSHVHMLAPSALDAGLTQAGFRDIASATWDASRELEEWLEIVNDAARAAPLRIVVRALAEAGRGAGIGLSVRDGRVVFFHRWRLVAGTRPA